MAKPAKKFKDAHDPSFSVFAQEVAVAIARNKAESPYKDPKTAQKLQFEELVAAENAFRDTILKCKISSEIYKRFIQEIRLVNKNILSARPYFREASDTFSERITPILKANDPEALKVFSINFHMVKFIKDNWIGLWGKKNEAMFKRVEKARTILIENNLPLAINRAKIFYRRTTKGHLSFMDLIEISSMGLAAGVDKYVGEFKKNFIGVCIGRIVGNLIDSYSETVVHFYPNDRRILYRANSIRGRQGINDIEELTKSVNDSFALDLSEGRTAPPVTTVTELAYLMAASSLVSSDSNVGEDGFGIYDFTPDSIESVETVLGRKQQLAEMAIFANKLPILNRKVLRLKGIAI